MRQRIGSNPGTVKVSAGALAFFPGACPVYARPVTMPEDGNDLPEAAMSDFRSKQHVANRGRSPLSTGKVHVLGVGGTAMSAVAGLFRLDGWEVRGSDQAAPYPPMGDLLAAMGIPVRHPYAPENLDWGPDLVIVGNVIRRTNPEAVALLESGLPYRSFPEALREHFLADRVPLVVAGTHGKTTTTSLIAHLLHAQGLDPSFLVGGVPVDFGINHRLGAGRHFVVEGDEYDTAFFDKGPKFLHYAPQAAIINNIEFDHADIFADLDAVKDAFARFAAIVPAGAPLLVPDDDVNCRDVLATAGAAGTTFGIGRGTWQARDLRWGGPGGARVTFGLHRGDRFVGTFASPMVGEHNLRNAVAALALIHEVEAATPALAEALTSFQGIRKRQEVKGVAGGVTVIDDFAHHPTAVRETMAAVRAAWPKARIIALFEVESNTSRRRVFQDAFAEAFAAADEVLFCRPHDKPDNLPPDQRIDMERLCADIAARGTPARLIPDIEDLAEAAAERARPGDVVLAMSGRDFHGIHARVLARLAADDTRD
jgi:UDP-N-acetylmuramate: L-alanyl-gamma-D-glutamyl-meso-diaminopimelate ligase